MSSTSPFASTAMGRKRSGPRSAGAVTGAARATTVDCGALYERLRRDLVAQVLALDARGCAVMVRATPAWTVRDVLSHVTGITEDLNSLSFDAADADAWTRAQVTRHRDETVAETVAAWDREAPRFEAGLGQLGYEWGAHYVADLLVHLTDVRASLGLPIPTDEQATRVALDFYLDDLHAALTEDAIGTVDVETPPERRTVGAGTRRAGLRGDAFDVLRACAGRRTLREIRALAWTGDADPFVARISRYPVPESPVGA
jgi:hypothetical protein